MVKLNFKILWRTKVKFRIPRPQPFTYASIAILSFVAYAGHNSLKNPLPEKPPVVLGVENRKTIRSCLYNLSNRLKVHKNLLWATSCLGSYNIISYLIVKDTFEFHEVITELREKFHDVIDSYETLLAFAEYKYSFLPKKLK